MRLPSALIYSVSFLLSIAGVAAAQQNKAGQVPAPPTPQVVSPEVHPDNTVTFRFRDPNAKEIMVTLEGAPPQAMQKDDQGVWSMTTAALVPDYYSYAFVADGVHLIDPSNQHLKPSLLNTDNVVHISGPNLPWELNDVPHGEIHHHFYKSSVADDERDYYVYTPPGYETSSKQEYPVLYLLHGYSDDPSAWVVGGKANVIFDNLFAQGKAKPMIVVMPLGYGTMKMISLGWTAWSHPEVRDENFSKFTQALLTEVMPRAESEYRIMKDRNQRAIAGLSMGGSETLLTGLNNLDKFSWIGAFSSGGIPDDFQKDFPALDAKVNSQLHLLWIACGTEDRLITVNRNFREWLKTKGINHTDIETPGMHTWMVWRRNLSEFTPLLFR